MNSKLLENMGLGNLDIAYVLIFMLVCIIALAVLVIIQINQNKKLQKKYEKFLQGKNAKSLESQITELCEVHDILKKNSDVHTKQIKDLYKKHKTTFQKSAIVKYDAFKEMGGKLSFCLVMLDEENDGFILNSVHSSDGCYSYTKKIKNGESEIELGNEERYALEKAMSDES
ncbi:MAG: DUF4446 family protein [Lachnospiraceae bacterium]|nr:DUF4446 family protein [Lachnospiraceae bacterium]